MKKVLLTCFFAAQAFFAFSQIYVEGVKLEPSNTGQYIELDPQFRSDGRCTFTVDYGQPNAREKYVTDEAGHHFDFHSLVDGLNAFYDEGWEVAQVTDTQERGRRFLLKRRY
ncbi:MAG: hypothetical protein LCH81_06080 [Bacteroidetes bacterium]|nr:hypothetical protein [Bacteroidota bacterium]